MSKKLVQIRQISNVLQLTWIMNNICTNHCAYCPPTLHMGTNHHYDWEKTKGFINRLCDRYQSIHVSISGGEPTMSPHFPELVRMFYDRGHTVGITSNAARTPRFWEEISPYLSYICFSWHPSFEDPKFLEKAMAAREHTAVSIRVMMDSRYWNKAHEFYNKVVDSGLFSCEPVRILPEMADRHVGDDYTPEQLDWLANVKRSKSNLLCRDKKEWRPAMEGSIFYYDDGTIEQPGDSNFVISSGQNDFRGWACNIGVESLFIHYDGWVKKGNCVQGGPLFHIDNHEMYDLPTNAEICLQKICHCGTDVNISKVKVFDIDDRFVIENYREHIPKSEDDYQNAYAEYFDKSKKKSTTTTKIVPEEL